jgi:hypothetical protein
MTYGDPSELSQCLLLPCLDRNPPPRRYPSYLGDCRCLLLHQQDP